MGKFFAYQLLAQLLHFGLVFLAPTVVTGNPPDPVPAPVLAMMMVLAALISAAAALALQKMFFKGGRGGWYPFATLLSTLIGVVVVLAGFGTAGGPAGPIVYVLFGLVLWGVAGGPVWSLLAGFGLGRLARVGVLPLTAPVSDVGPGAPGAVDPGSRDG